MLTLCITHNDFEKASLSLKFKKKIKIFLEIAVTTPSKNRFMNL
jgi:hypothetical protein